MSSLNLNSLNEENTNLKIEIENLKRQITLADTLIIEINIKNQRLENEITDLNFKLETYQNSELTNIAYQTEIKELNTTILYLKNELENFTLSDSPIKDKKILEEISKLSNNINTFSDFKKEFENFISNKDKLHFWKFLLWCKLILESFHSYFFWNSCCNIHETEIICSLSNERFFLYFLEIFFFILTLNTITTIFKNASLFILLTCWYGLTGVSYILSLIIIQIFNFLKFIFTKIRICCKRCCCSIQCEVFFWFILFFFLSIMFIFHILPRFIAWLIVTKKLQFIENL